MKTLPGAGIDPTIETPANPGPWEAIPAIRVSKLIRKGGCLDPVQPAFFKIARFLYGSCGSVVSGLFRSYRLFFHCSYDVKYVFFGIDLYFQKHVNNVD